MSKGDFLSGFSGGATQKPLTEKNSSTPKAPAVPDKTNTKPSNPKDITVDTPPIPKKSTDSTSTSSKNNAAPQPNLNKATRPAQSASAIIKAPEHVVTTDQTFHKRQVTKYAIFGGVAIVIAVLIFFIVQITTRFEVPNFVGRPIGEQMGWQLRNTQFNHEYAHSLYDADIIIDQNIEPGTRVAGGTVITVTISLGPDMDEVIELPDLENMTRGQINTWATGLRMRGINFQEEHHSEVPANHVIRLEFGANSDPDHFRRSDTVRIVVSSGPQTLQVPNLVGRTAEQLAEFIEENTTFDIEIEMEPHSTIARGSVLSQSASAGSRIPVDEVLVLTVSAGTPTTMPNFAQIRMADAPNADDDLTIIVNHVWHDTIPFGRFISQSVPAGTEVYGENAVVTVSYSRGRPWIQSFLGQTQQGLEQHFVEINDLGGSFLTLTVEEVNHYAPRGTVIYQSHYDQFIGTRTHVTFRVSRGNLNPPVDTTPPPQQTPPQSNPENNNPAGTPPAGEVDNEVEDDDLPYDDNDGGE